MKRDTPEYKDAVERVKIKFFTESLGLDIRGIIHVGTNYGYELHWYHKMGIENIMGFEPVEEAFNQARTLHPYAYMYNMALGDKSYGDEDYSPRTLTVYAGDGQGSGLMLPVTPDPNALILRHQQVHINRFDSHSWLTRYIERYNCLVIDVEGHEFHVLKGFGKYLREFDMISVELSDPPMFVGQAPAPEVVQWLSGQGFQQCTAVERHNDVMFIHKRYGQFDSEIRKLR